MGAIVEEWFAKAGAFLIGGTTYNIFSGFWPQVTDPDNGTATKLNGMPKCVVSNTLTDPQWARTRVLAGDAMAAVRELKATDGGELQVHGSAGLATSLPRSRTDR